MQDPHLNLHSDGEQVGNIDDMMGMIHNAFGISTTNELPNSQIRGELYSNPLGGDQVPLGTNRVNVFKLIGDSEHELYPGYKKYSKLSFIMHLFQLKWHNGWSGKFFSMLLILIKDSFPRALLPSSYCEAKKLITQLGLGYEKYHSCPNDCMLYYGRRKDQDSCDVYGVTKWMTSKSNREFLDEEYSVQQKKMPAKVLCYFPLIPRLKRIYTSPKKASSMRWHHEGHTNDGMLRHSANTLAWKSFDTRYLDFVADHRNVRFGLSSDGFNPFRTMNSTYSTWPIVLTYFNLSPWLCMKEYSMMLSIVIPGEKGLRNDIDVYLQPLIEELQQLWEGVNAYYASTGQNFKLRASVAALIL